MKNLVRYRYNLIRVLFTLGIVFIIMVSASGFALISGYLSDYGYGSQNYNSYYIGDYSRNTNSYGVFDFLPQASDVGDRNNPLELYTNTPTPLPDDVNPEYMYVLGHGNLLISLELTSCFKNIDFRLFETNDYDFYDDTGIYSTLIGEYSKKRILITSEETKLYFIRTTNKEPSCTGVSSGNITIYESNSTLQLGVFKNITATDADYIAFNLRIIENKRYGFVFQNSLNKSLEIDVLYNDNDLIDKEFYSTLHLYNNSQFTAKTTANAMVMVRSYHPGTHNFNLKAIEINQEPTEPFIDGFSTAELLIISLFTSGIIYLFQHRKKMEFVKLNHM